MSQNFAPLPTQTPLVEPPDKGRPPTWLITRVWASTLRELITRVQAAPYASIRQAYATQEDSIGVTQLIPVAAAGLYRIVWYLRIVRPATVSSSLTLSILSEDGGVTITQSGAAVIGNTTGTVQGGSGIVRADPGSPISFSTAYVSNGATAMQYDLELVVEQL